MSASVILIRPTKNAVPGSSGYEVLVMKRAADIKFPNFYAFPGGMLDKEDYP